MCRRQGSVSHSSTVSEIISLDAWMGYLLLIFEHTFSQGESQLYILEDNEAVVKMIIKRRSLTVRHVLRTHSVALDRLFDRINLDPKNPNQIS